MAVKTAGPFREGAAELTASRHAGRRAACIVAAVAACAGLYWCFLRLSATYPAGSDGASNALEARDLLHGNWLLHGWTLTDVSFYPTELPEYAAIELIRGLGPGVVHAAAALTYTLLVLSAALLARGRARGREGWARALLASGIMVAPQLGNGIHLLLAQPDHLGTQVPLLGVFLLADRAPRHRFTPPAMWALLTVATLADKITIMEAVVPVVAAVALRAIVTRRLAAHHFELRLAAAAIAAAGTAEFLLFLIRSAGGFTLLPVKTGLAAPATLPGHLALAWHGVLNLYGADAAAAPAGPQTILTWTHAPGVALAIAAFAVTAWRLPARCDRDLVGDVLAIGIVVNLAAFLVSVIPETPFDTREIAAVLPFGAVLAGRVFGPGLAGLKSSAARTSRRRPAASRLRPPAAPLRPAVSRRRPAVPRLRLAVPRLRSAGRVRPAVAGAVVAGACQLVALGYGAAQPPGVAPEQALAGWLAAHGLTSGLGTFTEDNVTTLDSGGTVWLRTVSWLAPSPGTSGGAVPRLYQSSASWYDPRTRYANFVVTGTADGVADLISRAAILALAGLLPARTYRFQSFTIMVWDENLLARLGGPPSHVPGAVGRP